MSTPRPIRNVAIIAHVDHGKTTLVDAMLQQTGTFRDNQAVEECVMDSNELEKERGITILAKNTVVEYQGVKVNIIDTPGHADFGGEVERVLSMADGVLLLVDAAEGPMPQTRFVLGKAFQHHLVPIVVVNKVDKQDARCAEVLDEVFDLFIDLDADEDALEFPVLYGSGRAGWLHPDRQTAEEAASKGEKAGDLQPLFDAILDHIPAPKDDPNGSLQFRVTSLEWSDYVGRIAVGRVHRGTLNRRDQALLMREGESKKTHTLAGVYGFAGMGKEEVDRVEAGDLCGIYGIEDIAIGDTLTNPEEPEAMESIAIDRPTMSIMMRVNNSPFAGKDGKFLTSRHLRERLEKELRTNVALHVQPGPSPDSFHLSGRGVMHLGFLLETMRREGFEFAVAKPAVITREIDGVVQEPIERLTVDSPEHATGKVIEILGERRAELVAMMPKGSFTRIEFTVPARGLIGVRTRILNASGGEATLHHVFDGYEPHRGPIAERPLGVLISSSGGKATFHSLDALRDRGNFFVLPATEIYEGMVIGEHCKDNDLVVNLAREKQLNNIRSSTKEAFVKLPPPRVMGVEEALEYVAEDELVEITPNFVRLRKTELREAERRRTARQRVKA